MFQLDLPTNKRERERERALLRETESAREGGRERETALMIDARLPPLCSIEWLQQKAQNNIHDSALGFSPPPPPLFSCVSACRRRLRTLRCRGCAVTGLATETGSLASTS